MFRFLSEYSLHAQLPREPEELKRHVRRLSRMTAAGEHKEIFDHLYECLSILDSKSSSLLGFNSIILAVFAIFMTQEHAKAEWLILSFGMGAMMISSFFLLAVVWVHWSTNEHLGQFEKHALTLLRVRRKRTVKYRLAWYFSVTSVACLAAFLAHHTFFHLAT